MKALTISRFALDHANRARASKMFAAMRESLPLSDSVVGVSAWHNVEDDTKFMWITEFSSFEALTKTYDDLLKSGAIQTVVDSFPIFPDVQHIDVLRYDAISGFSLHASPFISLSDRVLATAKAADDWVKELNYIFEENSVIPGYDGILIGKHRDIEEQVACVALWRTAIAYQDSIPENLFYAIDLYEKVA